MGKLHYLEERNLEEALFPITPKYIINCFAAFYKFL